MNYSSKTKLNLIIGDPVGHSLSPKLHNFLYQKFGYSDEYVFLASQVIPDLLTTAIAGCKVLNINGLAVTIPHKIQVIDLLDKIDPVAQKIGAVNTVVNREGALLGFNTDYIGVLIPLLKAYHKFDYSQGQILDFFAGRKVSFDWLNLSNLPSTAFDNFLKGKKVALIGAGGAARAVCFAALLAGGKLTIFNRTVSKAENLATEFETKFDSKIGFKSLKNLDELVDFDILINTASNELVDGEALITEKYLNSSQIIFDTVYKPNGTSLTKTAVDKQSSVIYGQEMLFWQGVFQCKYHLGIE